MCLWCGEVFFWQAWYCKATISGHSAAATANPSHQLPFRGLLFFTPRFSSLTTWPQDSSIEERSLVAAGQYPDLGAAADAIATIHELSLVKIKYALLDKWLPVETGAAGADDTMADFTLNLNSMGADCATSSDNSLDEVNLLRCVYLLQTGFEGGLQVNISSGLKHTGGFIKIFSIC